MPFFSVVIPVYNRAKFIDATINSVLEQTFSDYELIVVNDGSTDNSEEVIKKIAGSNAKLKYLWQENKERGAARNHGIKHASGTYVTFLDSDDLMHADHLAILYQKIKEQNNPDLIASKYILKRGGKIITTFIQSLKEGYYDINLVLSGSHFACNFAVNRTNSRLHLFTENRVYAAFEDWMFIVKNLSHASIYVIDAATVTMNDHEERSMRMKAEMLISRHMLAEKWIEENVNLNAMQVKSLRGHSYYFCAVHCYIDGHGVEAFRYLCKSIYRLGINKMNASLFLKNIFSYRVIQKLKG
jgi:glycosyltransferase involved in cell wall biosynthesis